MFPALLRHSAALRAGTNHVQEQLYPSIRALPKKTTEKRWGNGEDVLTPSQLFVVAILLHRKVQMVLTSCQFSHNSRFPSKCGDQPFLTSMINTFSPPGCLPASALQPHFNADGQNVKFQYSSSTSNCKMFRATLSSPHQAFTHQEAQ